MPKAAPAAAPPEPAELDPRDEVIAQQKAALEQLQAGLDAETARAAELDALLHNRGSGPTGFVRVEHPAFYPQSCIVCQSAKGPQLDSQREVQVPGGLGRLYLCAQCVKLSALELGLVDGDRQDELLAADRALTTRDEQVADLNKQVATMLDEGAAKSRRNEALEELLQQSRDAERTSKNLFGQIGELSNLGQQAGS